MFQEVICELQTKFQELLKTQFWLEQNRDKQIRKYIYFKDVKLQELQLNDIFYIILSIVIIIAICALIYYICRRNNDANEMDEVLIENTSRSVISLA